MNIFEVINGELIISGKQIKTQTPVVKVLDHQGVLIALLDNSQHEYQGRNVECFDLEGKKLWTIEAPQYGPHLGDPSLPKSTYGNILKDIHGRLIGASVDGIYYVINIEDGTVAVTPYPDFD
ncbi:hypothetical protein [Rubinisphaera sp.]|uniref:hypothetical protein n=1 Tax=Rubinisphaera sp. TaxID=2024857 RepID=UPI000C0F64C9|nr:hypothetical protein [Rubinisphaera sp.]MBV09289.1 hypothetical protein [Rubinisphaera sp.]HCS50878.1 hypothetical protein [Planctomycetaceae bacterium]|tara:strand:+ start:98 stop:463 length:366 start_codon:yes stop_codon:yes gene_type:complete